MGNCQAIDTATLVLQHPSGKSETMYWPVSANQIMKMHPGHYVALLITSSLYPSDSNHIPTNNTSTNNSVRVTRIKLLKSTDTLLLGQVYRLITTQEVTKSLWAKKEAKLMKMKKKLESEIVDSGLVRRSDPQTLNQVTKHDQNKPKTTTTTTTTTTIGRSKMWQPSLKSISEATQANN